MAIKRLSDNDNDASEPTPTPRARIPKPSGKAAVRTTVSYTADLEDNDNDESSKDNNLRDNEMPAFGAFNPNINYRKETQAPRNRLAEMFSELRDYSDNNSTYYALITRRADLMNDHFRNPCNMTQNFPPLQISSDSMMSFVSTVQRYNGSSGGRFDVIITDEFGESTDIGISHLILPDAIIEQHKPNDNAQGSEAFMSIMQQMMQQSEDRFAQMLMTIRPPEKDRLSQLMEQKIEREIMNPAPQTSTFNPEELITKVFASEAMLTTISERFSARMATDKVAPEPSTLEKILGNEMIVSKGVELIGQIAQIAEHLATQKIAPAQAVVQNAAPVTQPTPIEPTDEQIREQQMKEEQLIHDIISELESDNPINDDNAMIIRLKAEFKPTYDQLKGLVGVMTFDQLFTALEQAAPKVFDKFYENDELTAQGELLELRLNDLYIYLGGKNPKEMVMETEPETDTESTSANK